MTRDSATNNRRKRANFNMRTLSEETILEPSPLTAVIDHGMPSSVIVRLASQAEIARMREAPFPEKKKWFQNKCSMIKYDRRNDGHIQIRAEKERILQDSMETIMSLRQERLHMEWKFVIEDGGEEEMSRHEIDVAQEWYALVMSGLCDLNMGLWRSSKRKDQTGLLINPWSGIAHKLDDLKYFRFMGRIMGKAVFDGHAIPNLINSYLYKFIVGCPLNLGDLRKFDRKYYTTIQKLDEADDLGALHLNFTVTEEAPSGEKKSMELVPGGKYIKVTMENLADYKKKLVSYILYKRIRPQLNELLRGIYEVIPRPLLSSLNVMKLKP
eukprot:CAMPEP_0183300180 /NCGR_PEP_ID=MMETSP0160_2-20130417/6693_1 /TAXON_ID=2839 ORGANISM="Odontella Sinensis, Strain Grunow 1884" /NCGR_SAMPLE_ID=MMETSP0160_2 /ASSEMBLY_ACC=CAM_ASM_000250 /LENGTH=325 /DNA_ID=CAMNT_0025462553 /DNA_START=11 /DNA_END=989 /DNA_ORIENTATION=+